jgi:nitrite reductase/ring-hydroxylating ferredoxin subunit/uncharacterized membrane protein
MHRQVGRVIDQQASWAKPVGDKAQELLKDVFEPRRRVKDLLNGTWLGHPLHPMVTDVPVGAMTVAVLLDAAGQDTAADLAIATGLAGMAASAVSGVADAVDAYGKPQIYATVHASLMVSSLAAYAASMVLRAGPRGVRPLARVLSFAGYGAMAAGAYVGGDLTYKLGHQVDRHAFDSHGTKWKPLDVSEVPAGELVRGTAGKDTLVLYRATDGDPITALHAVCAHEGGPLDKGTLVDGCVECPWHQSRFRLDDGHVVQGPAVYDQPRFEVREAEGGGLEARRVEAGA